MVFLAFSACGSKDEPTPQSRANDAAGKPSPATAWTHEIKLKGADEARLVEVKWNESKVKVEVGAEGGPVVLKGELRDNGKRKYAIENGTPIAEVKADSSGFKLRTAEGRLLWKVKITDDKIKISDNEENANPYEIVIRAGDARIDESETTLGEVKFYPERNKVKVKDASEREVAESNTATRSVAYGVVLMSRIPSSERAIIMAELLVRGK